MVGVACLYTVELFMGELELELGEVGAVAAGMKLVKSNHDLSQPCFQSRDEVR